VSIELKALLSPTRWS